MENLNIINTETTIKEIEVVKGVKVDCIVYNRGAYIKNNEGLFTKVQNTSKNREYVSLFEYLPIKGTEIVNIACEINDKTGLNDCELILTTDNGKEELFNIYKEIIGLDLSIKLGDACEKLNDEILFEIKNGTFFNRNVFLWIKTLILAKKYCLRDMVKMVKVLQENDWSINKFRMYIKLLLKYNTNQKYRDKMFNFVATFTERYDELKDRSKFEI